MSGARPSTPILPTDNQPAMPPLNARLSEVIALFLKLGTIAFGGPAAHIALMRDEVVRRRRWVDEQQFLDLLGASNLIPGPNSTEMAIHLGYVRAGWRGLIAAGVCFILPAMLIVMALAWMYVEYGSLPQAQWLLYGVKPVIVAVVVLALWGLGRTAVKGPLTAVVGLAALGLYWLAGLNEIVILLLGGAAVLLARVFTRNNTAPLLLGAWEIAIREGTRILTNKRESEMPIIRGDCPALFASIRGSFMLLQESAAPTLWQLFAIFLKIGSVLYGSGYVLLAFLRSDFVARTGWLTDQQLLDAVAIGQFTPGPVFTTATFIGYLLGGWAGALVSTIGIFLPSFILVALSNPLVPRLRRSRLLGAVLDGVVVASLALMAAVTWELGRAAVVDLPTAALALVALALLLRTTINSAWLVLGGAAVGILLKALSLT